MEKLKKMAFGLKLYNKLTTLYPELLEKAPAEQSKKKITLNLGSSGQNITKKRTATMGNKPYNNLNK